MTQEHAFRCSAYVIIQRSPTARYARMVPVKLARARRALAVAAVQVEAVDQQAPVERRALVAPVERRARAALQVLVVPLVLVERAASVELPAQAVAKLA